MEGGGGGRKSRFRAAPLDRSPPMGVQCKQQVTRPLRIGGPPDVQAVPAQRDAAPRLKASQRPRRSRWHRSRRSGPVPLVQEPPPLPEVREDHDESAWSLWEESQFQLDSQLGQLSPSDSVRVKAGEPQPDRRIRIRSNGSARTTANRAAWAAFPVGGRALHSAAMPSARYDRLDALRGAAIVWMTVYPLLLRPQPLRLDPPGLLQRPVLDLAAHRDRQPVPVLRRPVAGGGACAGAVAGGASGAAGRRSPAARCW